MHIETAQVLKGPERRMFMAWIVNALGRGSQTWAERESGWCRDTIRKGQWELEEGPRADNFGAAGASPSYHSKYHPIERVWGGLEQHWNGNLLDTIDTTLNFAQTLIWRGRHPFVFRLTQTYHTGVRLTQAAMRQLEQRLERLPTLPKWFVRIAPRLREAIYFYRVA
jgi:hypothetical protein